MLSLVWRWAAPAPYIRPTCAVPLLLYSTKAVCSELLITYHNLPSLGAYGGPRGEGLAKPPEPLAEAEYATEAAATNGPISRGLLALARQLPGKCRAQLAAA